MTKRPRTITVTYFRIHLYAIVNRVYRTGVSYLITKHGHPIVWIVPYRSHDRTRPLASTGGLARPYRREAK